MKNLVIASIFLIPLSSIIPMTGTVVWYPQLLMLLLIGLSALAFQFWKMNKFISLLLIYEILSYIFVCNQSPRTMLCLICGFAGISIAYIISNLKDTKILYRCIIGIAITQSIYTVLQHFNIDPFFHNPDSNKADVVGLVGSHNQLGIYYSAVGIILASFNPILLTFSLVPIFLAKCNSAIIGLIAGGLVYTTFLYGKKWVSIALLAICLLAVPWIHYAGKSRVEIKERFDIWELTLTQAFSGYAKQVGTKEWMPGLQREYRANPTFGFGLGNFFVISPLSQYDFWFSKTHRYEHAHNDLIEALFELGYIGFILILFCIASVISDFLNAVHAFHPATKRLIISFSCLVVMAVSSLSVYVAHAPVSYFMFCVILGLFYAEVNNAKQSQVSNIT